MIRRQHWQLEPHTYGSASLSFVRYATSDSLGWYLSFQQMGISWCVKRCNFAGPWVLDRSGCHTDFAFEEWGVPTFQPLTCTSRGYSGSPCSIAKPQGLESRCHPSPCWRYPCLTSFFYQILLCCCCHYKLFTQKHNYLEDLLSLIISFIFSLHTRPVSFTFTPSSIMYTTDSPFESSC